MSSAILHKRESKKALNLGFLFRQIRNIEHFDEGLDRSFASTVDEKFALLYTKTLPVKI